MTPPSFLIPPNPARVPKDLLEHYATNGPRYTSYPTAPQFRADVDRGALTARWTESNRGPSPAGLSLYLHLPFCRERCRFCGCFTFISRDPAAADGYLDGLNAEFAIAARLLDPSRPVRQIALGGGTPNFLSPDRFDRLMRNLKAVWNVAPDAEVSVEIDPRTVLPEHVDVWLEHGFNRFSLGVQDFDGQVLEAVHRRQSLDQTLDLVRRLRAAGRTAVNFDLIYGLPGQTTETMTRTARRTAEIGPARIALYSYAHVPWMKSHQKLLERHPLPEGDAKLALFGAAWDVFVEAGYVPVEMDHFARPDDELALALSERTLHRNFMGYTTRRGLDLVGFGVSSISSVARTYAQNVKDFDAYHSALREKRLPLERGFLLSEDDAMRRDLIIDLFCNFHLDGTAFGARWGIDFTQTFAGELERLKPMEEDGLVQWDGSVLAVTPLGRAFIRNVCMVFDRYLEADPERRRYSKTV